MQIGRGSRRSIRYYIISGVLAGSVFSGSGAFGIDLASISADVIANNNITLVSNANYEAGDPSNVPFLGTTYFGSYSGIFSGNGATITGLTVPLFDYISGSVSDLNLETAVAGVVGQGILSNSAGPESIIDNVSATGLIESSSNNTGGLVGESQGALTNSSTSGTLNSSGSYVGGLVGYSAGQISQSASSMSVTSSGNYVGGLIGLTSGEVINSSASGIVESTGFGIVGGLVGYADGNSGDPVSITLSHATGSVEGYQQIGGLIGLASGIVEIAESFAQGSVQGDTEIGGLLGYAGMFDGATTISESYSVLGTVSGSGNYVGGLVGYTDGTTSITQSYSTNNVTGTASYVGGLVGNLTDGEITNSYAAGNVTGQNNVGGLVGYTVQSDISNSYAGGDVTGNQFVGGLVGTNWDGTYGVSNISNSYSAGDVTGFGVVGGLVGDNFVTITQSYSAGLVTGTGGGYIGNFIGSANTEITDDSGDISIPLTTTEILDILNSGFGSDPLFAQSETLNGGHPYLISLLCTYENACEDDDPPPPPEPDRFEREFREFKEVRSPEKIEKSIGFKNETPLPKSAPIAFVEATEKIDLAKVKAVEIAPTANVKVAAKAGEALQISLKSESKEPVELWVKSPDGSWLLAGVITFDKDGKAILPPLQFKSAGDYTLVLNKPSADSAKGSEPLNQSGSVLVAVS